MAKRLQQEYDGSDFGWMSADAASGTDMFEATGRVNRFPVATMTLRQAERHP
jgi:hypothetical protein